jgi:hypothetical protein
MLVFLVYEIPEDCNFYSRKETGVPGENHRSENISERDNTYTPTFEDKYLCFLHILTLHF